MAQAQSTVQAGRRKKRVGLIQARVGTAHMVRLSDGRSVSLTVKERRRMTDESKLVVRCLTCGNRGPVNNPEREDGLDESELAQSHPDHTVMAKRQEAHVWAWFCEEGLKEFEATAPQDFQRTQTEIAAARREYDASDAGLFSDELPGGDL